MNILEQIAADTHIRVEKEKEIVSLSKVKDLALSLPAKNFALGRALRANPDIAFICECKKASPSKGLIEPDFDYLNIAKAYEKAGADAISVLTEPKYFLGDKKYLEEIAGFVIHSVLARWWKHMTKRKSNSLFPSGQRSSVSITVT